LKSPKMDPLTWFRLIGKHLIAEQHRHHFRSKRSPDREQMVSFDASDLLINRIADSIHSVGAAIDQQQLLRQVQTAMQHLSPNDREIIEMRHVDEMTMQEAAVALELSLETAKKRYQRALKRFRELTAQFEPKC
jgi:RNA polymerase sigma-70 factor, ECF subfamily